MCAFTSSMGESFQEHCSLKDPGNVLMGLSSQTRVQTVCAEQKSGQAVCRWPPPEYCYMNCSINCVLCKHHTSNTIKRTLVYVDTLHIDALGLPSDMVLPPPCANWAPLLICWWELWTDKSSLKRTKRKKKKKGGIPVGAWILKAMWHVTVNYRKPSLLAGQTSTHSVPFLNDTGT